MRVAVPTGENVGYRGCVVVVPVVVAHVVGHRRWPGARLNRRASAKDDKEQTTDNDQTTCASQSAADVQATA